MDITGIVGSIFAGRECFTSIGRILMPVNAICKGEKECASPLFHHFQL